MDFFFDRRTFAARAAAFVAGWSFVGSKTLLAEQQSLSKKRLVRLGINALARAPNLDYFKDGHRGASMISAHMMCVDNNFDNIATGRIVQLFDLNWAPTKLCRPFPEADPVKDAAEQVGQALAEGKGTLREVGHDAIFAMHAIKAFRMLPETATPDRVEGACRLVRSFKPWRDITPDESVDPPPFAESAAASRYILKEASAAIERFTGFGQGFAGHMLTFGQSLVELAAMGHVEWAESCRTAFRKYVTVTRLGPKQDARKIPPHQISRLRPADLDYWKRRGDKTLGLGHVFKYPYAYYDLLARAKDPELEKELDAKAWRLF